MDTTMNQLRLFVHQRLYTAAEEILGEVEKTITLALYESEDQVGSLQHQHKKSAAEPSLTRTTVEHGDESDAFLQENPGPSQTSEDPDNNNCQIWRSEVKEEQEELWDDGQTQEMFFLSPEIVKSEDDQPETQVSYEMQPVSSDCSAAQSENNDSDEELVNSKGEQTMTWKETITPGQSGSVNEKDRAALLHQKSPDKSEKGRSFCHLCGKGFQYIGSLMKHIKTHEKNFDCTVCGKNYQSTKMLVAHVKSHHNTTCFCDVCGKTFANIRCLRSHERMHKGIKEFVCQECGKTLSSKEHLIVHVRTHSGEKPYHCDVCGKAFSQSHSLKIHKRSHSGEKPYRCDLCGKLFITSSSLQVHIRYHRGEKPHPCDICGKRFISRGQMNIHRITHTGERPYGCHVCGIRYRYSAGLKVHLKTHEKAAAE